MEQRSTRQFLSSLASLAALLAFLASNQALSQTITSNNRSALNSLGRINSYSPLEPAYAHGAIGFSFGLGWQARIFDQEAFESWGNPDDYQDIKREGMINAYLVKGFPWPVDLGVSAGQIPGTTVKRIGGHAQWTMYQGFRKPSLAARAAFSRLSGFQSTELASSQLSLLADYSLFRYFTIFIGYGVFYHQAAYQSHIPGWTISQLENSSRVVENWWDQHQSIGIAIRLLPPHFTISAEQQKFQSGETQWLGKLSFGM